MRVSRLADFAVVSMTHVAQKDQDTHTAAAVASATQLPLPTVAKVLARLCHAGLLRSTRGATGGYTLARPASAISVGSIVSAFDGPVALTRCIRSGAARCDVEAVCPARVGLQRINVAVRKALEDVSLAEVARPVSVARAAARQASAHGLPAAKAGH